MKEKITLPVLTNLLALRTGDTKKQSEDFLKEFFGTVASSLADGDSVKIKDLGVFKTMIVEARKSVNVATGAEHEIPAHRKVVFVPTKELAALINEPFEMFETEEVLDDSILDNATDEVAVETVIEDKETEETVAEPVVNEEDEPEPVVEEAAESGEEEEVKPVVEEVAESGEEEEVKPVVEEVAESGEEEEAKPAVEEEQVAEESLNQLFEYELPEESEETETPGPAKKRGNFWLGFLSGVAVSVLAFLIYYFYPLIPCFSDVQNHTDVTQGKDTVNVALKPVDELSTESGDATAVSTSNDSDKEETTKEETVPEPVVEKPNVEKKEDVAPTAPSDAPVYDYISKTRYLTTMAKDHYGNYHLWPYIYEENKAFLGHPDRIKPGTRVVIPDLKKYGVNPKNPVDIEKAKKKGVEIYSRYK